MNDEENIPPDAQSALPRMPGWVGREKLEGIENASFHSGAALAVLQSHVGATREDVPQALLRDRLALNAAEAGARRLGRPERAVEMRDEIHLLRPGEHPGPAGALFRLWRQAVRLSLRGRWQDRLERMLPAVAAPGLSALPAAGNPVALAAAAIEAVLADHPGEETGALVLGDCVLCRALGWPHPVPLLGIGLSRSGTRARGPDLLLACHRAVGLSAGRSVRLAHDLARRAERLRAVAPKLRARGAGEAVKLFLGEDALSPQLALSPVIRGSSIRMTDRAARRLCDRLVDLGAVRELTGRPSFRLYGL